MVGSRKNKRYAAVQKFAISFDVLKTLGELTSEHGGPAGSRKDIDSQPYTQVQKAWLEEATKTIIGRLREFSATGSGSLRQLTMADLPALA